MADAYRDDQITIEVLRDLGSYGNNAYLLRPADGSAVTIVDVPEGSEAILEALGDAAVERIVVTHSHFDHWNGFDIVRGHTDAPVFAGAEETNLEASRSVQALAHDATFAVGAASVRVIHTPGHTPGSICLHVGDAVLTGDTLFPGGPGRSGSPEALQQEIESITSRLYPLANETTVLPGHGDPTTIGASEAEYQVFASREHPSDLQGDVLWTEAQSA
jgi:glyoxylase-like metal-dependent hydrolase (beta-lactamase superfamily II)